LITREINRQGAKDAKIFVLFLAFLAPWRFKMPLFRGDFNLFVVLAPANQVLAPEQYESTDVGPAADQYGLCVSLYEALYGAQPFVIDESESSWSRSPLQGSPAGRSAGRGRRGGAES
jgi:hypothetical protein